VKVARKRETIKGLNAHFWVISGPAAFIFHLIKPNDRIWVVS
jgi:hypothetical protein